MAFIPGSDGKRRPAEIAVPGFLTEYDLAQYLADLFRELARPGFGDVRRID